jgi:hypothetical protein
MLTEKVIHALAQYTPTRRVMKVTIKEQISLENALMIANIHLEKRLDTLGSVSMMHYRDIEMQMVNNDILLAYLRRRA